MAFFTATPVARNPKDAMKLIDVARGKFANKESFEGFVSYFIARPKGTFPKHLPEGYLPNFKVVPLKGSALVKALQKTNMKLLDNGSVKTTKQNFSPSADKGLIYNTSPIQKSQEKNLPAFKKMMAYDAYLNNNPPDENKWKEIVEHLNDQLPKISKIAMDIMEDSANPLKTLVMMESHGMRTLLLLLRVIARHRGISNPIQVTTTSDVDGKQITETFPLKNAHMLYGEKRNTKKDVETRKKSLLDPESRGLSHSSIFTAFNSRKEQNKPGNRMPSNNCSSNTDCPMIALIADTKHYQEGVSFKNMRRIILGDVPRSYTDLIQQVGRASRSCAQKEIPVEWRNLKVDAYMVGLDEKTTLEHINSIRSQSENSRKRINPMYTGKLYKFGGSTNTVNKGQPVSAPASIGKKHPLWPKYIELLRKVLIEWIREMPEDTMITNAHVNRERDLYAKFVPSAVNPTGKYTMGPKKKPRLGTFRADFVAELFAGTMTDDDFKRIKKLVKKMIQRAKQVVRKRFAPDFKSPLKALSGFNKINYDSISTMWKGIRNKLQSANASKEVAEGHMKKMIKASKKGEIEQYELPESENPMKWEDMLDIFIKNMPLMLLDERRRLQIEDQQIGVEASFCALHSVSIDAKLLSETSKGWSGLQQCSTSTVQNKAILKFAAELFNQKSKQILYDRGRSIGKIQDVRSQRWFDIKGPEGKKLAERYQREGPEGQLVKRYLQKPLYEKLKSWWESNYSYVYVHKGPNQINVNPSRLAPGETQYQYSPLYYAWDANKLHVNNFKEILENVITNSRYVFLVFRIAIEGLTGGGSGRHSNVLIINKKRRVCTRFEPHGAETSIYDMDAFDEQLEDLINGIEALKHYQYERPRDFCPLIGVQTLEHEYGNLYDEIDTEKQERTNWRGGWCWLWSMMFITYQLANPNVNPAGIMAMMLEDPNTLSQMIRAFLVFVYRVAHMEPSAKDGPPASQKFRVGSRVASYEGVTKWERSAAIARAGNREVPPYTLPDGEVKAATWNRFWRYQVETTDGKLVDGSRSRTRVETTEYPEHELKKSPKSPPKPKPKPKTPVTKFVKGDYVVHVNPNDRAFSDRIVKVSRVSPQGVDIQFNHKGNIYKPKNNMQLRLWRAKDDVPLKFGDIIVDERDIKKIFPTLRKHLKFGAGGFTFREGHTLERDIVPIVTKILFKVLAMEKIVVAEDHPLDGHIVVHTTRHISTIFSNTGINKSKRGVMDHTNITSFICNPKFKFKNLLPPSKTLDGDIIAGQSPIRKIGVGITGYDDTRRILIGNTDDADVSSRVSKFMNNRVVTEILLKLFEETRYSPVTPEPRRKPVTPEPKRTTTPITKRKPTQPVVLPTYGGPENPIPLYSDDDSDWDSDGDF